MIPHTQFCRQDTPGLYIVPINPNLQYTCDIFFIHGLAGGPTRSWRHPDTNTIWFQDLLPDHIINRERNTSARIWTFGYNAGWFSSAKASIYDYAKQLLSRVHNARDGFAHHKIIWICYSLGGLVVKSALIEARLNEQYRPILDSTVGIVFLGTPHQGTRMASMAVVLARIAEKTLLVKPPKQALDSLMTESDFIDLNWRQFPNVGHHIKICSFYEMMATGRSFVVEKSSALTNMPGEEQCGLDTNHANLSKYSGHDDQNFVLVSEAIRRLMRMTEISEPVANISAVSQTPPNFPIQNPAINMVSLSDLAAAGLEHPTNVINLVSSSNLAQPVDIDPPQRLGPQLSRSPNFHEGQPAYSVPSPAARVITHRDVPQLVYELTTPGSSREHINSAAYHLARIAQTPEGRDHVATAVDANAIQALVGYLSATGDLKYHAVVILSTVLYFEHTWHAALNGGVIPLLVGLLSDPSLDIIVCATCGLANITRGDSAKKMVVEAGVMPPLIGALGSPSLSLKEMAARLMKNITLTDVGRKATSDSNAVQRLVALLDDARLSLKVQLDVVSALAAIGSHSKDGRKKMKQAGAFQKLTRFKNAGTPNELQKVAIALRDRIR